MSKQLIVIIVSLFVVQLGVYYWSHTSYVEEQTLEKKLKELFEVEFSDPYSVEYLDLSDLELTYLPSCFEVFIGLRSINLSNNNLTEIPSNLLKFKDLRNVNVSNNRIEKVHFNDLYITADGDLYTKIFDSHLGRYNNYFDTVDLSHNEIVSVIFDKTFEIRNLNLSHNHLENITLMNDKSNMSSEYNLSYNQLKSITFQDTTVLQSLNLSNNNLERFEINAKYLWVNHLNLNHNNINELDASLCENVSFSNLYIEDNPLESSSKTINLNVNKIITDSTSNFMYDFENLPKSLNSLVLNNFSKNVSYFDISTSKPLFQKLKNLDNLKIYDLNQSTSIHNDSLYFCQIEAESDIITIDLKTSRLEILTVNENAFIALMNGKNDFSLLKDLILLDKPDKSKKLLRDFSRKYSDVNIEKPMDEKYVEPAEGDIPIDGIIFVY